MSAQGPIILVGLPGAGKSKVGRLLAERLGVAHIDTDALIVEREGRPIADIFASDGEAAFRLMETTAVADALAHEAVVSLGGGAAATPAVRELLSGHTVVSIDAPHEELVRPSGTLARLRTEREPHYRSVATIVVESGPGPVDDVVTAIAQQLEHS